MDTTAVIFLGIGSIICMYASYAIGHIRGYKKGLDYGEKVLEEYQEYVIGSIRNMRASWKPYT